MRDDTDDELLMADAEIGTPMLKAKRPSSPNGKEAATPPKVRRGRDADVQSEILGAIHKLTYLQTEQGKAAEQRHSETLQWQETFRDDHSKFKGAVETKLRDVDLAIDEIKINTAKALSLAEEAFRMKQKGGDAEALNKMLKDTEARLSKFVIEEIHKATLGGQGHPRWTR